MAKRKTQIEIGKLINVKGREYKISAGTAAGKKYKATPTDGGPGVIQFGAKGYKVAPGTERGQNYCARSFGIKTDPKKASANDFARLLWNCDGKKSLNK